MNATQGARPLLLAVLAAAAACGPGAPAAGGDSEDAGRPDRPDNTDVGPADGNDADSAEEHTGTYDGRDIEPCPDAEGDCGWRCCAGRHSEWDPYGWCLMEVPTEAWLELLDAERVMPDSVGVVVPPLDGWVWRADGSEAAAFVWLGGCRWDLECQDWCWQVGAMVFVIDVNSDRQLHVEYIRDYVGRYYSGDWPYLLGRERPPRCPSDVYGGDCSWFEIPERGIAYVMYWEGFDLTYDLDWLSELPVVRGVLPIYDLATHERVGGVDIVIPDKVCGPHDPECP